jgi:hypothetical protein
MKKSLFILAFCFSIIVKAQFIPMSDNEKLRSSVYVIEGEVITKSSYATPTSIYTDYEIKVLSNKKDNVMADKIILQTEGGVLENKALVVCPSDELEIGDTGIFYLIKNNIKYVPAHRGQSFKSSNTVMKTSLNTANITSVSPTQINAGIGEILTITGTNFGTGPSAANKVMVSSSNSPGGYITMQNAYEYISWSDTEIKIKFPSKGGTGPIRVGNSSTFVQSQPIQVGFNVKDNMTANGLNILPIYLQAISANNDILFTRNVGFNIPDAIQTTKNALDTWSCQTQIKWSLDENNTTNNLQSNNDGLNTIFYASTGNALGVTYSAYSACSVTGRWYVSDIDIAINSNTNFNYTMNQTAVGQYDYYKVILHELGHAHSLGHTLSNQDLMFPSMGAGPVDRSMKPNDINGGQWVFLDSNQSTVCNRPKLHQGTCLNLSDDSFKVPLSEIILYPNPVKNILNVKSKNLINSIEIFNALGKNISTFKNPENQIDISDLSSGIYFVKINDEIEEVKVIKIIVE